MLEYIDGLLKEYANNGVSSEFIKGYKNLPREAQAGGMRLFTPHEIPNEVDEFLRAMRLRIVNTNNDKG